MGDYDFLKLYDGVLCMYVCMWVGMYMFWVFIFCLCMGQYLIF